MSKGLIVATVVSTFFPVGSKTDKNCKIKLSDIFYIQNCERRKNILRKKLQFEILVKFDLKQESISLSRPSGIQATTKTP